MPIRTVFANPVTNVFILPNETDLRRLTTYRKVGNFHGSNFCGLGSSEKFVGLYFCGVPPNYVAKIQ